jgi:parallel beta-helix repeat protein
VAGNTVDGAGTHGIFVATSNDVAVTGNRVDGAANAGIRLSDGAQDNMVSGNRIIKNGGTNGITISGTTADGNTVALNDLTGNGWTDASALIFSTAATTSFTGGSTVPGANLVS